jgi:hypothetical protein
MIGIVENVRYVEVDDPNRASPRLEYIITGRDFGKIFESSVYFNPIMSSDARFQTIFGLIFNKESTEFLQESRVGTPDQFMKASVNFYLGKELDELSRAMEQWYVPGGLAQALKPGNEKAQKQALSFIDILDQTNIGLHKYDANGVLNSKLSPLLGANLLLNLPTSSTIWSVLQYIQNPLLNELFTDLRPVTVGGKTILRPSLIHRQIPFCNKAGSPTSTFAAPRQSAKSKSKRSPTTTKVNVVHEKTYITELPRHNIKSSDIRSKNIGKSDFERVNGIAVVPRLITQDFQFGFSAAYNVPSLQRYGLRMLQGQNAYVLGQQDRSTAKKDPVTGKTDPSTSKTIAFNPLEICEKSVDLLQDWHFLSHALYNGTLIVDGFDEFIGLGNNVYIEDVRQLFHIEGYKHTYEISPTTGSINYNTELSVSRGQIFNDNTKKANFIDPDGTDSKTVVVSNLENIRNVKTGKRRG